MSDNFDNNNIYSSNDNVNSTPANTEDKTEASYEWNSENRQSTNNGEYRYSYVNGNNKNASHNPNNYETAYSNPQKSSADYAQNYGYASQQPQYGYQNVNNSSNGYSQQAENPYNNTQQNTVNNNEYSENYQSANYANPYPQYDATQTNADAKKAKKQRVKKPKKPSKPVTGRTLAVVAAITIIISGAVGFCGSLLADSVGKKSTTTDGGITINRVESSANTSGSTSAVVTSSIVKKTADSVVEIATESVTTGSFNRQYITEGAGSGVIISEDGYIVTNHHVIDGASNIKVTFRDGTTTYQADLIGSDADNDLALLKIDADNLSAATFGNSSNLSVGDYVVAIGNPLGELGGTVTDGIISALAREVVIEESNMTLLQTNAQINPGNSGGGLFNANGELVGIVNAKQSATEVEGIGFAIPVNNVLDVVNDLKSVGYVTGKIDLGMQFTDISTSESAFFYGISQTGCYVVSVTRDSNADKAGFRAGDIIKKVGDTEVYTSAEVKAAVKEYSVGDTVSITVTRNREEKKLNLVLEEYIPTNQSPTIPSYDERYDDSIWSQMFGW
ncbi:MAG: trypsin-like peptidase domain-containing protein [Ruminococcus sp.]|nr:trypsin-like peptidase domain-containing protein [Ruminococcus sp.]